MSAALAAMLAGNAALAQQQTPVIEATRPAPDTPKSLPAKSLAAESLAAKSLAAKSLAAKTGHKVSRVQPIPRPANLGVNADTAPAANPAPKPGLFANLFDQTTTPAPAPLPAPAASSSRARSPLASAAPVLLADPMVAPADAGGIRALVSRHARHHGLPDSLAHRIVMRESRYNPRANARGYYGLMQISLPTARQMGYRGAPSGLLDAETNLIYAMPYLANAWLASGSNEARAVSLYSRGYYYEAKRKGLLGQLRTASSPARVQASAQP
jgi:soluble lytic murein transglycosylase-like protein